MVTKLKKGVSYTTFKAWVSALHDWLASHAQLTPEQLGPASLRAIIRLTIDNELYTVLEQAGALGIADVDGQRGDLNWKPLLEHLRDYL